MISIQGITKYCNAWWYREPSHIQFLKSDYSIP